MINLPIENTMKLKWNGSKKYKINDTEDILPSVKNIKEPLFILYDGQNFFTRTSKLSL